MFANCYKGRRVFITGHTGFKGSWLAAVLPTACPPVRPTSRPCV